MGDTRFPALQFFSGAEMHKGIVFAFGCGFASAIMSTAGQSGSGLGVLLANFAMLPPIMIGLAYGTRSAAIASLTGLFAVVALSNLVAGGIYGVTIAFPSWLVVRYGLMNRTPSGGDIQWYPVGHTLAKLAGYGAMVLVLAAIANFDTEGGFRGAVEDLLGRFFADRIGGGDIERSILVERTVQYFPGIAVAGWLLVVTINSVLAQYLLARRDLQVRPTPRYSQLEAPEWLYWALVGSAVLALAGGEQFEYIGRNLVVVFAAPFFFIGLGIVHLLVRRFSLPGMALMAFYILLVVLGWPMVAVAGLGFFEQWTGLRKRYVGLSNDPEEEE